MLSVSATALIYANCLLIFAFRNQSVQFLSIFAFEIRCVLQFFTVFSDILKHELNCRCTYSLLPAASTTVPVNVLPLRPDYTGSKTNLSKGTISDESLGGPSSPTEEEIANKR